MKTIQMLLLLLLSLLLSVAPAEGQSPGRAGSSQVANPVYRLTVVGRTIPAVNYNTRSGPTKIDLRGTVLQPAARGEATVESKRGATVIDAKIEELSAPTRFGLQYLTYVLWAITPDGRAANLGEVVLNHADKSKLHVTTDFPAFGLIVTAEPYYAVTQPGDVVVMENAVRADTAGKIEIVNAKYELLARGGYTFAQPPEGVEQTGKKLRMDQYEALLHLYQARNAVQIAKAEGADRYATDTFEKAQQFLDQAEATQAGGSNPKGVITAAREATQAAEDARTIAARRLEAESLGLRSFTP
jgi:hypothetical protein